MELSSKGNFFLISNTCVEIYFDKFNFFIFSLIIFIPEKLLSIAIVLIKLSAKKMQSLPRPAPSSIIFLMLFF